MTKRDYGIAPTNDEDLVRLSDLEGLSAPTVQIFTSGGTWNKPSGLKKARTICVGGGAAGGGAPATGSGQVSAGNGGTGGNTAESWIAAATLGASETVTVGAGGTGASGADGNDGGTSSLGSHVSAAGGRGGRSQGATSGDVFNTGEDPFATGTGDIVIPGESGEGAVRLGSLNTAQGGKGGTSVYGPGGRNRGGNGDAFGPVGGYGGGGGGAANTPSNSARSGAGGAGGIVIVVEYY